MLLPWYARWPALAEQERQRLAHAYPDFQECTSRQDHALRFHGIFSVASEHSTHTQLFSLTYPRDYPYAMPRVRPLIATTLSEPHDAAAAETPQWFSARHQMMTNGDLCVFQQSTTFNPITGVAALQRAETWWRYTRRGPLPPWLDSLDAELQEHYNVLGQVIFGPRALDADLRQTGQFLALARIPREDRPLLAVTHIQGTDAWINDQEVMDLLLQLRMRDSDRERFWSTPITAEFLAHARSNPEEFVIGTYVTLGTEPPPVHDPTSLAALLSTATDPVADVAARFSAELLTSAGLVIALRFPARPPATGHDWLVLRVRLRPQSLGHERVPGIDAPGTILDFSQTHDDRFRNGTLGVLRLQDLRAPALQLRNKGTVPTTTAALSAAIFGVGAIGSTTADLLAKAGIGTITLWDYDQLESGNILRHVGGLDGIGCDKTSIVEHILQRHNPHCQIKTWPVSILDAPPDALFGADLHVSTIANDNTDLVLNSQAITSTATVYYLRALRSGSVGELLRVRPREDACLQCLQHYLATRPDLVIPPGTDEVVHHECGQPVLAGSAADLTAVAAIGVRHLLDDLTTPGRTNYWVWSLHGVPGHPRLAHPFSELKEELTPHASCTACAPLPTSNVNLPDYLKTQLWEWTTEKAPKETGGILLGERHEDVITIRAISDAGPAAEETPTGFLRDGAHAQAFLEAQHSALGPTVTYVGEWHSHPESRAQPSLTDLQSLAQISIDQNFATPAPLLLILGRSINGAPEMNAYCIPNNREGYAVSLTVQAINPGA